jgi:DNA-binding transcriptional MerR regulator
MVSLVTKGKTERLTIDELAREAGMTVRNIRAHQSRGLIPAPEIRGRTGFYGPEHVARLQLIAEMQADGFNLASIKRLLEGTDGSEQEVLGFKRALMRPFEEETPEFITEAEIEERFGAIDPKFMRRSERLGILRPLGDGRYEVPSPTLWRAGEELLELGIGMATSLDVMERIRRHTESIARTFVDLFWDEIWKPFEEAGLPEEDWPRVREALERLRPLASDAVLAAFRQTMTAAVEKAFGELIANGDRHRSSSRRKRR